MTDVNNDDGDFEGANPYNMNKSWHDDAPDPVSDSADNLFVPPKKKAPAKQATPQEDEGKPTHDFEKRYNDLKSHHDRTIRELREQLKSSKPESKTETALQLPKTKEELDKFKEQNPELYDTMQSIAKLMASEQTTEVKTKLSEIEKREYQLAKEKARREVQEAHPDFDTLRNDDDFHRWAEAQPKQIQDWIYNNPTDGALAIKAINLFKAEVSKTSKGKESKRDDGADSLVSTKTANANVPQDKKVWSLREIKSLSVDEYDQYEKEIDLAIRQGRVVD